MFDQPARATRIGIRFLFAFFASLLITACADSEPESESTNNAMVPISVSLVSTQGGREKAASENLLDLNHTWSTWTGAESGIRFDPASETLTIPATNGDAMVIGVHRYELALTEGAQYTLTIAASNQAAAALLFLFDNSGSIVPASDAQNGLLSAQPGAPLVFTVPAGIAGFYVQVQNAWQATRATDLTARLTVEVDDPIRDGTELLTLDGSWPNWSGEFNEVGYLIDPMVIQSGRPEVGAGNRYGISQFNQALKAGQVYQLRTLNASDPGATTLLFLFDANGTLIPFTNPSTEEQASWLAAGADQFVDFVAPDGVAGFAIQVQSGWGNTETTTMVPSLIAVGGDLSCEETLQGVGETQNFSSQMIELPSTDHSISDDGKYAAFISFDEDLLGGVETTGRRAYWQNLDTGSIQSIVAPSDSFGIDVDVKISGTGRYIFLTTTRGTSIDGIENQNSQDLFRYDRVNDTFTRITPEIADTLIGRIAAVSTDGDGVLFYGNRATLIGDTTNHGAQLIEYTHSTGVMTPVEFPELTSFKGAVNASSDLRYLVFHGLIGDPRVFNDQGQMIGLRTLRIYLLDRKTGLASDIADTGALSNSPSYFDSDLSVSADGEYVIFPSSVDLLNSGQRWRKIYRWSRSKESIQVVPFNGEGPSTSTNLRSVSGDGHVVVARHFRVNSNNPYEIVDLRSSANISVNEVTTMRSVRMSSDGKRTVHFTDNLSTGFSSTVVAGLNYECN